MYNVRLGFIGGKVKYGVFKGRIVCSRYAISLVDAQKVGEFTVSATDEIDYLHNVKIVMAV